MNYGLFFRVRFVKSDDDSSTESPCHERRHVSQNSSPRCHSLEGNTSERPAFNRNEKPRFGSWSCVLIWSWVFIIEYILLFSTFHVQKCDWKIFFFSNENLS